MKATLTLLDGRPMTIKEESSRPSQLPSSPPLQHQIHADVPPGIGNAIKKKDEEGKKEDGNERNSDEINQEPMQSSPQSEICGVSERLQGFFFLN